MSFFFKHLSLKSYVLTVLLSGFIGMILLTYTHYGTTFDEADTITLGKNVLSYYLTFGRDTSFIGQFAIPEYFLTRGAVFEVFRETLIRIFHANSIDSYHLVIALFSVSVFYFMFQTVFLLTKNVWISVISFLLLVCSPRFYGDIFTNSKDIATACFLMGSIYYSVRYLVGQQTVKTVLPLGVFIAFSMSLRPALVYAYVLFFVVTYIQMLLMKRSKSTYFLQQILLLAIASVVFFISSPYIMENPATVKGLFTASQKYPWNGTVLFNGISYSSTQLPWYYLPLWIAISTPVVTLLFFALGNIRKSVDAYTYSYIVLLFWIPVFVAIVSKVVIYDAWRQFLFLSGPLVILSSLGVQTLLQSKRKTITWLGLCLIGGNLFVTAQEMITLHPYEYIYFNSLVGGLKGANGKFETDYWGASFKEATEWIVSNKSSISKDILYISPCLHPLAAPYIKPGVVIDNEKATVLYCYTRGGVPQYTPDRIIHIVEREGVPLNIIRTK